MIQEWIDKLVQLEGSDLYVIAGSIPSVKKDGKLIRLAQQPITAEETWENIKKLLPEDAVFEFKQLHEYNTAIPSGDQARLRVNLFQQRQMPSMVIRRIQRNIPTPEELGLHPAYVNLVMQKRGLVLLVGQTDSGKSTSLASMIQHRNQNASGHIVTIEDPLEFMHDHHGCIVSQRDIGLDTSSLQIALKNAMRQSPDVLMIGEIRDLDTMDQALSFAESGHLVLSTLHANNAHQAIERMLNFFPGAKHAHILLNLSLNLRGILSQRLVQTKEGSRTLISEVMLNEGAIRELIQEGKIRDLREHIEKLKDQGMQTFDQALIAKVNEGVITEEVALSECDNPANMRLAFSQQSMKNKLERNITLRTPNSTF